jgi:hypothetical protein
MRLATADEQGSAYPNRAIKARGARGEVLHRVSDLTYNRAY